MISIQIQERIAAFHSQILTAKKILIVSHLKPDGDAVGASLALKLGLQSIGKSAEVVLLDTPPERFSFLPHFFSIQGDFAPQDYDMAVLVDCGDWSRTGFFADTELHIDWPDSLVVVDHHAIQKLTPGTHIVDATASSASELVFYILEQWGVAISKDIATCLLVGISTDTGSFQHTNTSRAVLAVAGILMEKGASLGKITRYVYADKAVPRLKLWGRVLQKMYRNPRWNMLVALITQKDMADCGASDGDLEGVIDLMRTVPNVRAVILGSERDNEFKFNLRTETDDVDVSRLAALFGGGGHVKASGFSVLKSDVDEVIPRI